MDMEKFHKRARCFIDQYSNIRDASTGKRLNGISTFSENLPDHAGLRAAYYAYRSNQGKWNDTSSNTVFTPEQTFFIGYGLVSF
jgi:predicted metalloendopeptidase